ncbi:hypothetical protein DI383_14270 [Flavobacteriaceae bacterium LYZ1037]|nr:hypothetical protein DI383_14270 [Flavobacteriaceae bacterium LYZ1037]
MSNKVQNKTLCWLITNKCNRSCSFCISKSSPIFKIENYNSQIKLLIQIKKIGANKISISGGEPFVVKDLKKIIEFLIEINMDYQVTTNSDFFIKKGVPNWVFEYKVPIILSLYGGKNEHNLEMGINHFNNVLEIAKKFKREQVSVNIIETEDSIKFINNNIILLMNTFSRVLLIKKMNDTKFIKDDNFIILKRLFDSNKSQLKFQFLYHNYEQNEIFPVINDRGDITFTSNNKTDNIGSIFSSEITFKKNKYKVSEFFKMIWDKQYTNQKMKLSVYE